MGHFNSTGGVVSQVTNMTLTQTGPDANGFFSATGTATITGGKMFLQRYCGSSICHRWYWKYLNLR